MATESLPEHAHATSESLDRSHLEPRRGMRLGRYELLLPIARGGMAEVWIARQTGELGFRRLVALKTIRPEHAESPKFRRMFLDEAQLASRIHHANVVEVVDLGEEGPIVFQAMTLIEGDSLAGLLRRWHSRGDAGGLPPAIVLRVMADAASGLHAAHELTDEDGAPMRLVHRDVSPHNILVGMDGVAKIADFGIAKALGRLSDETEAGQMKGKFSYLSPEQVLRAQPDRRSDVFSAGIVLWEMLTGVRLFRGIDVMDTLEKVRAMRIPDVREIVPDMPAAIAEVAARALTRLPSDRFATAAAFADALEHAARVAGAVSTTKDVGHVVARLVGDEVERRREGVREASRGGTSDHIVATSLPQETAAATTIADPQSSRPPTKRSRAIMIGGGIALLVAAAGSVIIVQSRGPKSAAAPADTSTPTPTSAITNAPAATDTSAASVTPTATTTASAVASTAPSSEPAGSTKKPTTRSAPPPRTAPPPPPPAKPKFGNPYAQ